VTAPAFVQSNKGSTSSGTNSQQLAFLSNLALSTHRFITLRQSGASNVITGVAGSVTGAYGLAATITNLASTVRLSLWYAENGAAGAETVVATTSTTGNSIRWGILEYSGLLAAASLDFQTSARYTTTTTPATSSQTTAADNALCLAFLSADTDVTTIVPGGTETSRFTDGVSGNRFEGQDFVKAVAGSVSSSWTCGTSQPGVYIFAAFKSDTGGGLPTPGYQQYQQRRSTIITL